jgi:hypothetical protein
MMYNLHHIYIGLDGLLQKKKNGSLEQRWLEQRILATEDKNCYCPL